MKHKYYVVTLFLIIFFVLASCENQDRTNYNNTKNNLLYGPCLNASFQFSSCEDDHLLYSSIYKSIISIENFIALAKKINEEYRFAERHLQTLRKELEDFNRITFVCGSRSYYEVNKTLNELRVFIEKHPNGCAKKYVEGAMKYYSDWLKKFD